MDRKSLSPVCEAAPQTGQGPAVACEALGFPGTHQPLHHAGSRKRSARRVQYAAPTVSSSSLKS
jgi:hypothetical protein